MLMYWGNLLKKDRDETFIERKAETVRETVSGGIRLDLLLQTVNLVGGRQIQIV